MVEEPMLQRAYYVQGNQPEQCVGQRLVQPLEDDKPLVVLWQELRQMSAEERDAVTHCERARHRIAHQRHQDEQYVGGPMHQFR